jgi:capsular polysaccharide biosynthesis protein
VNQGDFQDRRSHLLRDSLRYHYLLVAALIVLGAAAGVALGVVRPTTYSSSTTLLLNQIPGNPYNLNSTSNSDTLEMLQTEAVAVTSQDVLSQVSSSVANNITPERLRQQTVVTVPPNTQALQITYRSTDRSLAPKVVDAIATTYLASRRTQADAQVKAQVKSLASQLKTARAALVNANKSHDPSASSIRASVIDIQGRIATFNSEDTRPGRVLAAGSAPSGSRTRHLAIFGGAGLVLGALAGLAAAVWRERKKDLVRSVEDLQDYEVEAPVTRIPGARLDDAAMRHLRMRLAAQIQGHETVALVGLSSGQSLRFGVLLGKSLAAGGKSVVLVDGTGTDPKHRDVLNVGDEPGLSEALLNNKVPTPVSIRQDFDYVPPGASPHESSEHYVDERAPKLVHGITENHDLALIACLPPDTIEGEALARLSGSVLLLVQLNKTSHFQLAKALRVLSAQRLRLSGVFVLPRKL